MYMFIYICMYVHVYIYICLITGRHLLNVAQFKFLVTKKKIIYKNGV